MRRVRAVVEVKVPDGHNFSEADFAKSLRRQFGRSIFSLAPVYRENRPITFKEFGRVVQFDENGSRIAPPKTPTSFERLVLHALFLLLSRVAKRDSDFTIWRQRARTWLDDPDG